MWIRNAISMVRFGADPEDINESFLNTISEYNPDTNSGIPVHSYMDLYLDELQWGKENQEHAHLIPYCRHLGTAIHLFIKELSGIIKNCFAICNSKDCLYFQLSHYSWKDFFIEFSAPDDFQVLKDIVDTQLESFVISFISYMSECNRGNF